MTHKDRAKLAKQELYGLRMEQKIKTGKQIKVEENMKMCLELFCQFAFFLISRHTDTDTHNSCFRWLNVSN